MNHIPQRTQDRLCINTFNIYESFSVYLMEIFQVSAKHIHTFICCLILYVQLHWVFEPIQGGCTGRLACVFHSSNNPRGSCWSPPPPCSG